MFKLSNTSDNQLLFTEVIVPPVILVDKSKQSLGLLYPLAVLIELVLAGLDDDLTQTRDEGEALGRGKNPTFIENGTTAYWGVFDEGRHAVLDGHLVRKLAGEGILTSSDEGIDTGPACAGNWKKGIVDYDSECNNVFWF